MIKAVLLDMDGLMFDTERIGRDAWMEVGRRMDLPVTEAVLAKIRGSNAAQGARILREAFQQDFDYEEARRIRNECMEAAIAQKGLPVKEGLKELLSALKDGGYRIALATSTRRETAVSYLRMAGVEPFFDAMAFGDMVRDCKPNPEIFLLAAKLLGLDPAACLVLEDSANGVLAALNGGMHVICIPDLTPPPEDLLERADAVFSSLRSVYPYLEHHQTEALSAQ